MNIAQEELDKVDVKLNKQNALGAVLGAALWTFPALIIWNLAYNYNPSLGPIMLLLNGFIIGLAIRFHGRGMQPLFSILALLTHSWITLLALDLEIVVSGTTWAIFLFGLYATGAGVAMFVARIQVPFEEHRAHSYLTSSQVHASSQKLKNRWFVTLPLLIITVLVSSSFSIMSLVFINEFQAHDKELQQAHMQDQRERNKEIDLTPNALKHKTAQELLLYSYAYHTGLLFNKKGHNAQTFPRSTYKATTILKYLIKHRDNARAKFILGFLTGGTKGYPLLQSAVEQGDGYAKIYYAVDNGCYVDSALAIKQLKTLRRLFNKEYLRSEIDSILYIGFNGICSDIETPEFSLAYARNYTEQ